MDYLSKLSIGVLTAIAGLVGSLLGIFIHAEINTLRQRFAYFFGGLSCSVLLSWPIADIMKISVEKQNIWMPAIGFTLGIFGMALLQRAKHTVDNLDIGAVIAARFRDILSAIRGPK